MDFIKKKDEKWFEFQMTHAVPMKVDMFKKPHWECQKAQGIKNLPEVYQVMLWRGQEQAQKYQPHPQLRADVEFIAALRFSHAHGQLTLAQQSWPLTTLRTILVLEGKKRGVGREALILACMLEAEAVTFIPKNVAQKLDLCRTRKCRGRPRSNLVGPMPGITGPTKIPQMRRPTPTQATGRQKDGNKGVRKEVAKGNRLMVAD